MDLSFYRFLLVTQVQRRLDKLGITQAELAKRTGVSASFLSDLQKAKANPSLDTMAAVAHGLGMTVQELLDYDDLPPETLATIAQGEIPSAAPPGFKRVSGLLPNHLAFITQTWMSNARIELAQRKRNSG